MSKERLVELIEQARKLEALDILLGDPDVIADMSRGDECLAEYLLDNGVVVLPVNVKQADRDVLYAAETIFDAWNDVTDAVPKGISWYYELQSVIQDIVKLSFGAGVLYREEAEAKLKEGENNA